MSLPSEGQLMLWREMPDDWSSVSDLAGLRGCAQSTMSEALSALHEAGFIRRKAAGKFRFYKPRPSVLIKRGL